MYSNLLLLFGITECKIFIFIYYRSQFKKNHYPNQVNQMSFSSKADHCFDHSYFNPGGQSSC